MLASITPLSRDKAPNQRHRSLDDKARSRHEERLTEVFLVGNALAGSDWQGLVASL